MTHEFATHDAARIYVETCGLRPTITPGVFRRACISRTCPSPLHHDVEPVMHSERILGPAADYIGRDRLRVWRAARARMR